MRNKPRWFLYFAMTVAPTLGLAGEGNRSGVNVGELAIVQSQTILLKAKAERAKAEHSINGEGIQERGQHSAPFHPQVSLAPARSTDTQQDLPVVKAVFGSGKRLRATLLYSSGFEVDADLSSRELPGGYQVVTLTVDSVTLERQGQRYPLGFSNLAPTGSSNSNSSLPGSTQPLPILPGLIPGQR